MVILQRAGHDLRRRSGTAVDQDHNRQTGRHIARFGIQPLALACLARAGGDDFTLTQEITRYRNRLVQQTTRVVP